MYEPELSKFAPSITLQNLLKEPEIVSLSFNCLPNIEDDSAQQLLEYISIIFNVGADNVASSVSSNPEYMRVLFDSIRRFGYTVPAVNGSPFNLLKFIVEKNLDLLQTVESFIDSCILLERIAKKDQDNISIEVGRGSPRILKGMRSVAQSLECQRVGCSLLDEVSLKCVAMKIISRQLRLLWIHFLMIFFKGTAALF